MVTTRHGSEKDPEVTWANRGFVEVGNFQELFLRFPPVCLLSCVIFPHGLGDTCQCVYESFQGTQIAAISLYQHGTGLPCSIYFIYIYIWVSPLHMSWPFIKAFEFIRLSYIHQFFQEEDAPAEASEDHEDWNVLRAQVSPERNMVLECDDMLQCLPEHGTEIAGHIRGTRPPGNEKRSDVSTYTFQRKVAGAPDAKSIGEHLHVYL